MDSTSSGDRSSTDHIICNEGSLRIIIVILFSWYHKSRKNAHPPPTSIDKKKKRELSRASSEICIWIKLPKKKKGDIKANKREKLKKGERSIQEA